MKKTLDKSNSGNNSSTPVNVSKECCSCPKKEEEEKKKDVENLPGNSGNDVKSPSLENQRNSEKLGSNENKCKCTDCKKSSLKQSNRRVSTEEETQTETPEIKSPAPKCCSCSSDSSGQKNSDTPRRNSQYCQTIDSQTKGVNYQESSKKNNKGCPPKKISIYLTEETQTDKNQTKSQCSQCSISSGKNISGSSRENISEFSEESTSDYRSRTNQDSSGEISKCSEVYDVEIIIQSGKKSNKSHGSRNADIPGTSEESEEQCDCVKPEKLKVCPRCSHIAGSNKNARPHK